MQNWDPIGISSICPADEYDSYIGTIALMPADEHTNHQGLTDHLLALAVSRCAFPTRPD
jgi:hypothetical protein